MSTLNYGVMEKIFQVSELMTADPVTIGLENSLSDASNLFKSRKIRHLPVVSDGKLVGILSYTDILRISFGNAFDEQGDDGILEMLGINQVMKHSPVTVAPEDSVKDAARILAEKEFHALPVVEEDKLIGIITTTDIINHFLSVCN